MGIKKLTIKEILLSFPAAIGVFIVLYFLTLLLSLLPAESQENLAGGFRWEFSNYAVIPLVILTSLVTGYREELFFRSYLISRLGRLGFPEWGSVLFSGMLFSVGHLYQGWAGFLVSFSIGIYFGLLFIYRRNIHFIAVAHALYNTAVLLLSNVIPAGEPQNYVAFFQNII